MENIVKMKYDMTALVVIDQTFVLALRYDLPSWLSIYYYHYYILFNLGVFFLFCFFGGETRPENQYYCSKKKL